MGEYKRSFDINYVHETPAEQLVSEMYEMFMPRMLEKIETKSELDAAQRLMGWCMANHSYLASMAELLKIEKRTMKREGVDKKSFDEMLSKEEIFETFADLSKRCYDATSRMVTVYQLAIEEMKMNGDIAY